MSFYSINPFSAVKKYDQFFLKNYKHWYVPLNNPLHQYLFTDQNLERKFEMFYSEISDRHDDKQFFDISEKISISKKLSFS